MIKTVRDAWQIPELRRKILFTIFALLIFRLGAAIPVPYINTSGLETYLSAQSGTILGLMNAMSGSAFSMATLFALSIQPYINSSIIILWSGWPRRAARRAGRRSPPSPGTPPWPSA